MVEQEKRNEVELDKRATYFQTRIKPHGEQYKEFHAPSVEVLYHLFYTYDVVVAHLAQKLRQHNLSLSAFNVLLILSRSEGQGTPLFELSELLVVSRANVTGLVDCLEQRGLIARVVTEGDRRVKRALLTTAGENLLRQILPDHYTELRTACSGLESQEKTLLVELLTSLRRGVQATTLAKAQEK